VADHDRFSVEASPVIVGGGLYATVWPIRCCRGRRRAHSRRPATARQRAAVPRSAVRASWRVVDLSADLARLEVTRSVLVGAIPSLVCTLTYVRPARIASSKGIAGLVAVAGQVTPAGRNVPDGEHAVLRPRPLATGARWARSPGTATCVIGPFSPNRRSGCAAMITLSMFDAMSLSRPWTRRG
jgi:hypothetical protein